MNNVIKGINRGGSATLTLTDTGVQLEVKGKLGSWGADEEIKYLNITNVQLESSWTMSKIKIMYFGDELQFSHLDKKDAKEFVKQLKEKIQDAKTKTSNPLDKLKKAKELLDLGVITSEEFESVKTKYLKKI